MHKLTIAAILTMLSIALGGALLMTRLSILDTYAAPAAEALHHVVEHN